MDLPCLIIIILAAVSAVDGVLCYRCQNVSNVAFCNQTVECSDNEVCYLRKYSHSGVALYDLGCQEKTLCQANANHVTGQSLVGRSVPSKRQAEENCFECCSSAQCNQRLCSHLKASACIDDESFDCAYTDTIFGICSDIEHAKSVCPKYCSLCDLVDGNWAAWNPWSACDVTCGVGTRARTRTCTDPAPENGGSDCYGNNKENVTCQFHPCPVNGGWSIWSDWGMCSATCDVGIQRRNRTCSDPYPDRFGDHCFGDSTDDRICIQDPCSDGNWSVWERWGQCSVSCGTGLRSRHRLCDNPEPSLLGKNCLGTDEEYAICKTIECIYRNCYEIKKSNEDSIDGVYTIFAGPEAITVYCDMTTNGGGWTVLQRRTDGIVSFTRNIFDYAQGFGSLEKNFWLGLNYTHKLTFEPSDLFIQLTFSDETEIHGLYTNFVVGAAPDYMASFHSYTGTPLMIENNTTFSTEFYSNSKACNGGWWYNREENSINSEYGYIAGVCGSTTQTHVTGTKLMLRQKN